MTALADCALRTSEKVLVNTPPGGEKPGNEAVRFPAGVLARAASAATATRRRIGPAVISRAIRADRRATFIFADCKMVFPESTMNRPGVICK